MDGHRVGRYFNAVAGKVRIVDARVEHLAQVARYSKTALSGGFRLFSIEA